jgi:hypothetical protein
MTARAFAKSAGFGVQAGPTTQRRQKAPSTALFICEFPRASFLSRGLLRRLELVSCARRRRIIASGSAGVLDGSSHRKERWLVRRERPAPVTTRSCGCGAAGP